MESLNKPFRRRVTVFVGVTLVDVPQKKHVRIFLCFFPTTFSGAESLLNLTTLKLNPKSCHNLKVFLSSPEKNILQLARNKNCERISKLQGFQIHPLSGWYLTSCLNHPPPNENESKSESSPKFGV